jgi:hypothetical protein
LPSIAINPSGAPVSRRDPGDEALLELLGIERGQDVAQVVVRRRAVGERAEAAQQRQLLDAEQRDVGDGFRASQDREQAEQQDFVERVAHLALLAGVLEVLEVAEKDHRFRKRGRRRRFFHGSFPVPNRGNSWIQHSSLLSTGESGEAPTG